MQSLDTSGQAVQMPHTRITHRPTHQTISAASSIESHLSQVTTSLQGQPYAGGSTTTSLSSSNKGYNISQASSNSSKGGIPQGVVAAQTHINPHLQGLSLSKTSGLSLGSTVPPQAVHPLQSPQPPPPSSHSHLYVRAEGQNFAQRESFL